MFGNVQIKPRSQVLSAIKHNPIIQPKAQWYGMRQYFGNERGFRPKAELLILKNCNATPGKHFYSCVVGIIF